VHARFALPGKSFPLGSLNGRYSDNLQSPKSDGPADHLADDAFGVALVVMVVVILLSFVSGLRASLELAGEAGNWNHS